MTSSGSGGDRGYPLSTAIIERIAALEEVDPLQLEHPLNDAVDPDALDSLFDGVDTVPGHVVFEYCGYEVFADSQGRVSVEEIPEEGFDPDGAVERHLPESTSPSSKN
ncbi:HalOD1 output domain-containing protein [Halomarina litorea]|uniref:HalOD1 output domain-containing protein n=1 Tax=Halomarina litorea TaxID=2961595 RepID=UPI0020C5391E|nr:HalOD1 output domain-containing protein [Halomarina sp. BCD28]